ncbi:hypothetical protein DL96DRAFT_169756 [Flagelloscypha sp. PMI_526]|nr:hypothetical protein DL96DRAFT_169756 [Flagelloscypha sp. PMI_526]
MCWTCDSGVLQPACYPDRDSHLPTHKRELDFNELVEQAALDLALLDDALSDVSSSTPSSSNSPSLSTISLTDAGSAPTLSYSLLSPIVMDECILPAIEEIHDSSLSSSVQGHAHSLPGFPPSAEVTVSSASGSVASPVQPLDDVYGSGDSIEVEAYVRQSDGYRNEYTTSSLPSSTSRPQCRFPAQQKRRQRFSVSVLNHAASRSSKKSIEWLVCPTCGHRQHPKRRPDFRRHLHTHEEKRHFCCGVLLGSREALEAGLGQANAYEWGNNMRVGGCKAAFSRMDSLRRHLRNSNIGCIGTL